MSNTLDPQLGESNIKMLQEQIKELLPDDWEKKSIDFLAGFDSALIKANEAISNMWKAAEIVSQIYPQDHMTMEEMREITFTLRTIAETLEKG